jgi:defect in organelle trafficking protein DotB
MNIPPPPPNSVPPPDAPAASHHTYVFPEEPVRFTQRELDRLLIHCTLLDASDITIQSLSPVFSEIHGLLYHVTSRSIPHNEVGDMLNSIYGPNGTTQIASGTDLDTHYEVRPDRGARYRFRINATGCQVQGHEGIQITIRTIPGSPPDLASLELEKELFSAMAPTQGAVIITGSTGSGKSTLLAGIIKELAQQADGNRKILTYESPIEFVYDSLEAPTSLVSQSEIPRHLPSFAAGIRNALRRKPRLILVGEARDAETISAVIDAALTGHPVYTTLHSNGVADCVRRMISIFPAEERHGRALDILEMLRVVVWQKLVPTVDGKRVALKEFLIFSEDIRDELVETPVDHITAKTRELLKTHGQPMLMDAERKFKDGRISERTFAILEQGAKRADKDAGL